MSTTDDLPDRVTPENVGELSSEEIRRINEKTSERLRDTIDEEHALSETEKSALEALEQGVSKDTETVEVNGVELEVQTSFPGVVENRIQRISKIAEERPKEARNLLADSVAEIVVDDDYSSREVWREFGREYGSAELMGVFRAVSRPAHEHAENVSEDMKSFRS